MGLFDIFHQPPDPILSFTLDSRGPFGPGSPVAGYVTIQIPPDPKPKTQPPPPRQLIEATIAFYGNSATANTRSESHGVGNQQRTETIYYRDDLILFRHCYVLAINTTLTESEPFYSNFGFTFPYMADPFTLPSRYDGSHTEQSGVFVRGAESPEQLLPPSFRLDRGSSNFAVVEYSIEVTCRFEGEKEPFVVRLPAPLDFFAPPSNPPIGISQPPLSEFVQKTQRYSSSRLTGAEKSIGRSFKDKFSSSTPSVDLVLKVTLPTTLSPGSTFPIYTCVEVSNPSSPDITLPVADIRIKSLKWQQHVFYRALRCGSRTSRPVNDDTYTQTTVLNTLPENRFVEQRENIPIEKCSDKSWYYPASFEARIPGHTWLSLRTRNINCSYSFEVKLEAEVCGKTFDFKVEGPSVLVLSG